MTNSFLPDEPPLPFDRFEGIRRDYSVQDVEQLRGSVRIRHTLAEEGSARLWDLLNGEDFVNALGAMSGNQAMQMVKAGLKAIYLSGWQVAADANVAGQMYPDQSLYPADSVPAVVRRINQTLQHTTIYNILAPLLVPAGPVRDASGTANGRRHRIIKVLK